MSDLDLSFDSSPIGVDSSSGGSLGVALGDSSPSALGNPQIVAALYPGIPLSNPNERYSLTLTPTEASKFSSPQTGIPYAQADYDLQYLRAQGFNPPPLTWSIPPPVIPSPAQTGTISSGSVMADSFTGAGTGSNRGVGGGGGAITTTPVTPGTGTNPGSGTLVPNTPVGPAVPPPASITPAQQAAIDKLKGTVPVSSVASSSFFATGIGAALLSGLKAIGSALLTVGTALLRTILAPIAAAFGQKIAGQIAPNSGGSNAVVWILVGVGVIWMVG